LSSPIGEDVIGGIYGSEGYRPVFTHRAQKNQHRGGFDPQKKVDDALAILRFIPKAASPILTKAIKSAVAAASRHPEIDPANLFVKEIRTDGAGLLRNAKRFIPRAQGRASKIHVRTTHLTLVVSDGKTANPSQGA